MENWWPRNGSIPSRNEEEESIWRSVTNSHRRNCGPKSGGTKWGPKGWERGWGSWGGGSEPLPHQLGGLREHCKLPQRGSGQSPQKNWILVYFGTKFCHFSRLTWSKYGGTNNIGVPRTVISGGDASPASPPLFTPMQTDKQTERQSQRQKIVDS